jgi:hypothetical protein
MLSSSNILFVVILVCMFSDVFCYSPLVDKVTVQSNRLIAPRTHTRTPFGLIHNNNIDMTKRSSLFTLYDRGLSTQPEEEEEPTQNFDLAAWFNPNTRGGVIVWSIILFLIPLAVNYYLVSTGLDSDKVGAYVGALFVLLSNVAWASTYIFRVANKDMTYAKQLRDYENAVLEKRLEELEDDEIDALMEEIEAEGDGDAFDNPE